ncbi:MAG: glycosyltransferase [Clostridia bacterium]|nr:glycosyltransferase [Clostridia bacterium]
MITGQFNDSFPPIMDGVANVVKNYAFWLNRKYGQSYVVTPFVPNHEDFEDFKVYRYNSLPLPFRKPYRWGLPKLSVKVRNDLENIKFDIIHTHSPFSSGAFAMDIAKNTRIPIIATFHSKLYDDFKQELKSESLSKLALEKAIEFYESVDYVWAVNKGSANTLRSYGYNGFIDIIPNGTDFTFPGDYGKRRRKISSDLSIPQEEKVLLFIGQIIWQKNIKLILQAVAKLKQENMKLKIIFAGEGSAKKEFLQMIAHLKIEDYVIYLGPIHDRDYLKSLFARADLFVFPSVYDNAPIVVREAAALKCPSLLVKDSNASEGVIHDFNGLLCENDVDSFVREIKENIFKKEKLAEIGDKAYETLYRNWEQIVDEVYKKYSDILSDIGK